MQPNQDCSAHLGGEVAVVDGLAGGAHDELRVPGRHQPLPAAPAADVLHALLRGATGVSVREERQKTVIISISKGKTRQTVSRDMHARDRSRLSSSLHGRRRLVVDCNVIILRICRVLKIHTLTVSINYLGR